MRRGLIRCARRWRGSRRRQMYYLVQLRLRRAPPAPKANQNIDGADTKVPTRKDAASKGEKQGRR